MGAALLYHLALEACTDVVLIEKGELTSGSTWHAAGQCPVLVGNYNLAKLQAYGNELYPRLEELTGQYVSWHASGSIRLARTEKDLDWFKYIQGISKSIGFRMEIIDPAKIKKINPFFNTDGVLAGAWTPDDGHADPSGLTNAMARGATKLGAEIIRHNRVLDINYLPSGEWEVLTEKGSIRAETVVNAAGCYAREVGKMVGTDMPITNMEHHYIVTGEIPEFVERDEEIPVMRDPYASAYLRQEQKSGLVGIYEQLNQAEAWAPRGYPEWASDSELFADNLDRLMPWLGYAMERMPILENAGIKRIVCGAIPHSADGAPLLGPVAGLKNFWLCCGASFGIAQGAGCGKYLAQWMVHGDTEINMLGFDPRRFGKYADDEYMRAKGFEDYARTYFTALPGEELPAGRPQRTSPLYEKLKQQGCEYTETFGWERPKWFSLDGRQEDHAFRRNNIFTVISNECLAVRERVAVLDLSGFAKFDVKGADAEAYLNRLCANRMPRRQGGIVLAHMLSKNARINGEVTVTRLADDHFYVLSAAAAELRDLDCLLQGNQNYDALTIENVSDDRGVLVLAGPESRKVLAKLTGSPLENNTFPWLQGQEITVSGVPVRALRVNYVGELGWELHPLMEDLETLYDAIMDAGQEFGIANFGLYAVNSLRMEKAYPAWGAELTNEVTMDEAGMQRFVNLDKGDFVGRDAIVRQSEKDRQFQLVYLAVDSSNSDVRGGEPVFINDNCIGVTTSGAYGHYVNKSLGFAYVDPHHAEPGSLLQIELLGERHQAEVLGEAAHDPENLQLKT